MTLLEYYHKGIVKDFFDKGVISINVYTYFRYYEVYQAYKDKGHSNNKSYEYAADECGACESTIRRAVKFLTKN